MSEDNGCATHLLWLSESALGQANREVAMFQRKAPWEQEIACRAHKLYVQRGSTHGKDVEDRVRAEKELRDERVIRSAATGTGAQASRKVVN